MPSISMEESPSAGKKRRSHEESSLTGRDIEAALQLIQLSGDSYRRRVHGCHTNWKLEEEEEEEEVRSGDDFNAHASSSFGIEKILQVPDESLKGSNRIFQSIIVKSPLTSQSRQLQNAENTAKPDAEINAADRLLLLCDKNEKHRKEGREEERSNSGISHVTCESSAMGAKNLSVKNFETDDGEEGESRSETSDLCTPIIEWALEEEDCECLRRRKRKFRSVADLYSKTEPSTTNVSARKVRCR